MEIVAGRTADGVYATPPQRCSRRHPFPAFLGTWGVRKPASEATGISFSRHLPLVVFITIIPRGRAVIEQVASDLCTMFDERPHAAIEWDRYPPW